MLTARSHRSVALVSAAALLTLCAGTLHGQTLIRASTNYAGAEIPSGGISPVINPSGTRLLFTSGNSNTLAFNLFGYPTGHSATNIYLKNLTNGDVDLISWTGYFSTPPQMGSEPLALNLAGISDTASLGSNGRVAFQNFGDQEYMDGLNGVFLSCLPGSSTNGYTYIYTGGGLNDDAHEGWNGSPCFGAFINASMNDPCISPEGLVFAFSTTSNIPGLNTNNGTNQDSNAFADVYLKNISSGDFSLVSVTGNVFSGITQANGPSRRPSLSNNATHIAFESDATNLAGADNNGTGADIFVRDYHDLFDFTERISVSDTNDAVSGNGPSTSPSISGNGRYVAFLSRATNLVLFGVSANQQVYLRDRTTNTTTMVSRGLDGLPVSSDCFGARISEDGNWIVYYTAASNIVRGDTNGFSDTFVYSVASGVTRRVSVNTPNFSNTTPFQGNHNSFSGDVTSTLVGGGIKVAFQSAATNMIVGDGNAASDVFIRTLPAIPNNDLCANATTALPGVVYNSSTAGAAIDGVSSCGSSEGSPDVWYTVVADHNGQIVAHTNGSSYDTVLSAQLGCNGAQLACDDDSGDGNNSQIAFPVSTGQNIRFRVTGYNGSFGSYNFTFRYSCGAADMGIAGGLPGSDGLLDNNDFIAFINYFFASNATADVGIAGGLPGSDGLFDNNDFIAFINLFFNGC